MASLDYAAAEQVVGWTYDAAGNLIIGISPSRPLHQEPSLAHRTMVKLT